MQTRAESANRVDATVQRKLVDDIQLAPSLGAEVVKLTGDDVAVTLAPFAAERGVPDGDGTGRRCWPTGRVWRKHWYCSAPYRRTSVLMPTRVVSAQGGTVRIVQQGVEVRLPVQRTVRT